MEKERSHMTESILDLTLEIIYLLTGENYIAFKLSDGLFASNVKKLKSPVIEHSSHTLTENKKVEEVTQKMIELLTGEVPIRCQDVTVSFRKEENYLGRYEDLKKDVTMEINSPLTAPDGSSNRNPSERCPCPLYSQDSTQEHQEIPKEEQVILEVNEIDFKTEVKEEVEEQYVMGDEPRKEDDVPPEISTDGQYRMYDEEQCTINSFSGKSSITPNVYPLPSIEHPLNDSSTCKWSFTELLSPGNHCKRAEPLPCSKYGPCFTQIEQPDLQPKSYSSEKPYPCPQCGKCFSWKSSLITHEKIHKGEKPFVCSECGKCYPWRAFLLKHQKTHMAEKPFPCSECGKSFSEIFLLMRHQKTHTGDKPFSCSECPKCFSQKSDFERHLRTHTGERPYICSECNKSFSQKEQLITHQRSHTGLMPYLCTECGKCFSLKARLIIHQRTHTGESPYSCSVCGKGFKNKSNLGRHERVHTGHRPHLCSECGKGFTDKSDLMRHERVHTGAQPYSCSECGKRFSYKSTLVSHFNIHKTQKAPTLEGGS